MDLQKNQKKTKMKNTLLIITLLFSFSAIADELPKKSPAIVVGRDVPKTSFTGLEGWGGKKHRNNKEPMGVTIEVKDYSKMDKNFPINAIKTKVELRLRQAGITVNDKSRRYYDVYKGGFPIKIEAFPLSVGGRTDGYFVQIKPRRFTRFTALDDKGNKVLYTAWTSASSYDGVCSPNRLIPFIDSLMDDLLLDYLKANKQIGFSTINPNKKE